MSSRSKRARDAVDVQGSTVAAAATAGSEAVKSPPAKKQDTKQNGSSALVSAPSSDPAVDAWKQRRSLRSEQLSNIPATYHKDDTAGKAPIWIRMILPVPYNATIDEWFQDWFPRIIRPNVRLDFGYLDPAAPLGFITSDYANAVQIPYVIKACQKAQSDGCDGILIGIAFDTGMDTVKHVVDIPVFGALQSAVAMASVCSGSKFSILSISPNEVPVDYRIAKEYQFLGKLASVRPINVAVLDLQKDFKKLLASAVIEAKHAIEVDGADTIVLGCTGMLGLAAALQKELEYRVPVLDGAAIGLFHLEDAIRLNITQSKKWFDAPDPDQVIALTPEEAARYPVKPLRNDAQEPEALVHNGGFLSQAAKAQPQLADTIAKIEQVQANSIQAIAAFAYVNEKQKLPVKAAQAAAQAAASAERKAKPKSVRWGSQEIMDCLRGSHFYGAGGGGNWETAMKILNSVSSTVPGGMTLDLVELADLADDDVGTVPCDIGSPSQPIELHGVPYAAGKVAVQLAIAGNPKHTDVHFISSVETGVISYVVPMVTAFQLQVPIVNADGGGRAVPEMGMLTYNTRVPVGPLGLANTDPKKTFRCTLDTDTADNAEEIIRPLLGIKVVAGNLSMACWGGTAQQYKEFLVRDTLTRALAFGKAVRLAPTGQQKLEVALAQCGGDILYTGYCQKVHTFTDKGFDKQVALFGPKPLGQAGSIEYALAIKNENMLAFVYAGKETPTDNSKVQCVGPDLMSYFSVEEGIAVSNAELPDYWDVKKKAAIQLTIIASSADDKLWANKDIVNHFKAVMVQNGYTGPMLPYKELRQHKTHSMEH